MTFTLRNLGFLAGLTVAVSAVACASSDDPDPATPSAGAPNAGTGGTLGGSAGTGTGGTGKGGTGGTGKGGSGGSGGPCTGASGESAQAGGAGQAGAAGQAGETGAAAEPDDCIPTAAELPWLHVDGNVIKDPNGNTVVLRGVAMIDLGATEVWEGGVNAMIDRLTDADDPQGDSPGWATKVVRLMVGPKDGDSQTPIQYEPGGNYYEQVLRPAVDYARHKGLYAIIDWHYIDGTSAHIDTTNEFWADMAPRFAGDSHVLFELFNEPTNGGNWPSVKLDMEGWVDTVRAGATDNLVLIGTANWCQLVGDAAADPLAGTNLAYVAHMYPQHWQIPYLRSQIETAAALVPVFMTEWGFHEDPSDDLLNGTVTSYGAPLEQFVNDLGISWTAWAASKEWGPPMFNDDYSLRVGEGEMGGFVKDWLYEKRDADLPQP